MSIARDFIDYPYHSDLGAVQIAAQLARAHSVVLVDAFALPDATLRWRDDGRAHLGAATQTVVAACPEEVDVAIVAYTPFHRPPRRDDVLADVLAGLRVRLGSVPLVLADLYQSGQHYIESPGGDVLAAYPEVDAYVKYEAEVTVPQLVEGVGNGTRPGGTLIGERPRDLDALALPAWDLVDLAARDRMMAEVTRRLGRGHWAFPIDGRTLPFVSSRGCPFDCAHCSSNPDRAAGKTQRRRSAVGVSAAFAELTGRHGATRVAVLDEMINVHPQHLDAVLDAAETSNVRVDVPNGMRADHLERRHLVRMVGRITTLSISAESGSQRVLDEIVGKRLRTQAVQRVATDAHRLGLPLMIHYMIGLPGETAAEINETLTFALALWDDHRAEPAVQFATPLPGTRLANERRLPVVDDWGPRFQNTPSGISAVDDATLQRFKAAFDRRVATSRGPAKLIMNVTYACNNRCTFCAVGTRTPVDGNPTRQREYLARYRRQGVELVDFDGGEPTLDPELVPLVRYARALGYRRINVTTNGRLCAYPDFARTLVCSGLTSLLFSVHGADARTHAAQVGVAEAFDQTIAGIRNAVGFAPGGVELGMNVTVTKGNVHQLEALAELALSLGLPWLNIQFLTPFGRATRMLAPELTSAARIATAVIDRFSDRMKIQLINLPFCFVPGHEAWAAGDLGKRAREMVFVNNERVNLAEYLAARRVRKPVCATCPNACECAGFYELDDVPEPPWLVSPADLTRRIDP